VVNPVWVTTNLVWSSCEIWLLHITPSAWRMLEGLQNLGAFGPVPELEAWLTPYKHNPLDGLPYRIAVCHMAFAEIRPKNWPPWDPPLKVIQSRRK